MMPEARQSYLSCARQCEQLLEPGVDHRYHMERRNAQKQFGEEKLCQLVLKHSFEKPQNILLIK